MQRNPVYEPLSPLTCSINGNLKIRHSELAGSTGVLFSNEN